ncbi:hypothetical protein VNO77_04047 [Canavalia gladiata]|uniref:Uncharacterized protein n=1 Tax=Canavalia gladiata TaxID=3824 RepID=A0AAN9MWP5_CANGL
MGEPYFNSDICRESEGFRVLKMNQNQASDSGFQARNGRLLEPCNRSGPGLTFIQARGVLCKFAIHQDQVLSLQFHLREVAGSEAREKAILSRLLNLGCEDKAELM